MSKFGRPKKDEPSRPTTALVVRLDDETRGMLDELVTHYRDPSSFAGQHAAVVRKLIRSEHARFSKKK
jgi:predicted transcriptional regulator